MCNVTLTEETKNSVTTLVTQGLPNSKVMIDEGPTLKGNHLHLTVINDCFEGLPLLDQHRMIMDLVKTKFTQGLHAIKIKTMTNQKAKSKGIL